MADLSTAGEPTARTKKMPASPQVPGSSAFKGKGLSEFLSETWVEITKKTTWPTKPELVKSTTVVLAAIIAVSVYLAVIDYAMTYLGKFYLGR